MMNVKHDFISRTCSYREQEGNGNGNGGEWGGVRWDRWGLP